jgi:Protein of unknown function (DUF3341)
VNDGPTYAAILAEFDRPGAMLGAAARLRELGYRHLDTYSPYPVPGTAEALGLRRSRLPWFTLGAGLLGAVVGYLLQWYPNAVAYPLDAGGRPPHAAPAFVPITFEMAILGAALVTVVMLVVVTGLPRLWHPAFEVPGFDRASVDRFWVGIDGRDPRFDAERTAAELRALGALRVVVTGGHA